MSWPSPRVRVRVVFGSVVVPAYREGQHIQENLGRLLRELEGLGRTYEVIVVSDGNTDETVKRAPELGGQVIVQPHDIPQGRFAVLNDPQGAAFAVIQLAR